MFYRQTDRQTDNRARLIVCSFLTIIAFQIKLDLMESISTSILSSIINFAKSFQDYNIFCILLVPVVYHFYKYITEKAGKCKGVTFLFCLIPAILFSFFMLVGYSYDRTNSWNLIINLRYLQWLKVLLAFSGYLIFFYYSICYVFYVIDTCNVYNGNVRENKMFISKYIKSLKKKPFATTFVTLLIIYIPYMIISYPAIFGWDMDMQITQAYPQFGIYAPGYTEDLVLEEEIYLNNHHPIIHTLLIHVCMEAGMRLFSSYNAGLFLCALLQLLAMLVSISVSIKLLLMLNISEKCVCLLFLYYVISPRIQSYMFFITKDVLFAVFSLLLFFCLFHKVTDQCEKKHDILFLISALGIILFRNDGRYLLMLSFLLIGFLCKNIRKQMFTYMIIVFLFGIFFSNILLPAFGVIPGSVREMLTIPFQQTARYLRDSSDPATQEEKEAISAVLDYDAITMKYNPEKSDSVKDTFNEKATREELKEYFKVYLHMFLKHPSHYIQATINNYYYYFYPGAHLADYYWGYQYGENVIIPDLNDKFQTIGIESAFAYPKEQKKYREGYELLRENLSELPIVSVLKSAASYSWILILLVLYCLKKRNRKALALSVPLCIQLLIALAGPCNGWYFRYIYPIAVCLPIVFLLCLYLINTSLQDFK